MSQNSAISIKLTGNMFSLLTISRNSRGSSRSGLLRALKSAKNYDLSAKEVKDLNTFVKDKIDETIKECSCSMHAMSDLEDLSISSSNEGVQSITSDTSDEGSDNESRKPASKK
eukprot:14606629-Ditylum_brightwellii.AAC.1